MADFEIKITGAEATSDFLDNLDKILWPKIYQGFNTYVKVHLIARIKSRLANASAPHSSSSMVNGVPSAGGGYGTPSNNERYARWKAEQANLPTTGSLSTREMVATGHLVDSIDLLKVENSLNAFSFEVGVKPGTRSATTAYKSNPPKSNIADLSRQIDNIKLAEILEDTKYAFWAKEFEDVQRDIVPLVTYIIKDTIEELWKEYSKAKK